jgi:integrase
MARARRNPNGGGGVTFDPVRKKYFLTVSLDERYPSGRRKTRREFFDKRPEADRRLREINTALRESKSTLTDKISVGEFFSKWLEHQASHNRPKTVAFYEANYRRHIAPAFANSEIRRLQAKDLQALINKKQSEGLSPRTLSGLKRTLSSALNTAIDWDLISTNPVQRVKTPKVERAEITALTDDQARLLLETIKGHELEALIKFSLGTGVRVGEAVGLTWSNVDFDSETISIRNQLQRIKGQGLELVPLKSASSRRNLPMIPMVRDALREAEPDRVNAPLGVVFLNSAGNPFDQKGINNKLKTIGKSIGVPSLSFHYFRHTAATLWLKAGVPITVVRDLLGHSSIFLTTGTYDHAMPKAMKEAGQVLQSILQKA